MSKTIASVSVLAFALCFGSAGARAQNIDVFVGAGTNQDSSAKTTANFFGPNQTSPALGGSFGKIGADFMVTKHFGVGAEGDFRFAQDDYLGFKTRPFFYDFNGIYLPLSGRFSRVVPELEGGIGGVRMNFSYSQSSCDVLGGCSSSNIAYESSNHFQVHVAGAIRFYATKHMFIRPAVDFRYVPNFFQYGRNTVPEYGAAIGWSFGER